MKSICLAYRSDWNADALPPERIDFRPLTHIAHSFITVKGNTVMPPDERHARALVGAAHKKGVKVTLAIGGAESNASLTAACATETGAAKLADAIVAFVRKIGYDGVDIDWEMPENTTDGNRLTLLVRLLRKRLPAPYLVTMAVPALDWSGKWFDAKALIPLVDWFAIMTYDFYGPWSDTAGYHAALFPSKTASPREAERFLTASSGIEYWRKNKQCPPQKLVMGIPLYARGFRTAHWGDRVANSADKNLDSSYADIAVRYKAGAHRDNTAVVAIWESPDKREHYSGDDAVTTRQKGIWAKKQNIAGIFFWELSQDGDGKKVPSLVSIAFTAFEKGH